MYKVPFHKKNSDPKPRIILQIFPKNEDSQSQLLIEYIDIEYAIFFGKKIHNYETGNDYYDIITKLLRHS